MRIAFVTSAAHADLTPDDRLAASALTDAGAEVVAAIWRDEAVDWRRFDLIVLRSTWDYYYHAAQFREWIDVMETTGAPIWNQPSTLRWNMEKTYLRDLERAGVPIVPTVWLSGEEGHGSDLGALLDERGWGEAIVKPVISANATRTWRVARSDVSDMSSRVAESMAIGDVMLQPFIPEIQTRGEWSMMFIDGEFSHAVRKLPTAGDFRVQTTFGGASVADTPSKDVLTVARRAVEAAPERTLYARVDGIESAAGFVLVELEMLEPSLYFRTSPDGVLRFRDAVLRRDVRHEHSIS